MKILWLLSLLFSFIFAGQTQILLSSYANINNAKRAVKELNNLIKKDLKFQKFFQNNSLKTAYKKDGKYFSVVIKPFNNSKIRNKVLKHFKSTFKSAYVIKLQEKEHVKKSSLLLYRSYWKN